MIRFAGLAAGLATFLLAGCVGTTEIAVEPVKLSPPAATVSPTGRFAVFIQKGGFDLADEVGCGKQAYRANADAVYVQTMTDAVRQALGTPRFVAEPLRPEEFAAQGVDTQILVYQGAATSVANQYRETWGSTFLGVVKMTAVIAVIDAKGKVLQSDFNAEGGGRVSSVNFCGQIPPAYKEAIESAIRNLGTSVMQGLPGFIATARESP